MRMMLHNPEHRTVTAHQGINFKGSPPEVVEIKRGLAPGWPRWVMALAANAMPSPAM